MAFAIVGLSVAQLRKLGKKSMVCLSQIWFIIRFLLFIFLDLNTVADNFGIDCSEVQRLKKVSVPLIISSQDTL